MHVHSIDFTACVCETMRRAPSVKNKDKTFVVIVMTLWEREKHKKWSGVS